MLGYRKLFFCFHPSSRNPLRFYNFFRLRARFGHISAFHYVAEEKKWLLVEWTIAGSFYGIITDHQVDQYVAIFDTCGGEILSYTPTLGSTRLPWMALEYCVAAAKHHANIKSWAITPDQLFRALRRRGGRGAFFSEKKTEGELDGLFVKTKGAADRSGGSSEKC